MDRYGAEMPEKNEIRHKFRLRRDELDLDQAVQASAQVCLRLDASKELVKAERIAGYMALGKEIDIYGFLDEALRRGQEICLPRVCGPGQMEFCLVTSGEEVRPGAFGIGEPTGAAISRASIEFFLVPGLAFDRCGNRLGFGKGYYDRALPPRGEAVAIGVAHHWQVLTQEVLPCERHDRRMDYVVTDREWHQPPEEKQES